MTTGEPPDAAHPVFVEVSNTLSTHFTSGFQRHTRALLAGLPTAAADDRGLLVTPVVWCTPCGRHRHLDSDEQERLRHAPAPSPPDRATLDRLAERLPTGVGRVVVHAADHGVVLRARERLARLRRRRGHDPSAHPPLVSMPAGSVFFDLEAAWHDPAPRAELLPRLRASGVRTGLLVADVMPDRHPEWFSTVTVEAFGRFLRAHLEHSDHVASISDQTTADLLELAGSLGRTRPLEVVRITMGSDFAGFGTAGATPAAAAAGAEAAASPVLLSVGTLEPRKNQGLLLDVFDRLRVDHPDIRLVLIGRPTDLCADLATRIVEHPCYGSTLRWERHVDDGQLEAAYRSAFLALAPSRYEGYGIPVVEALAHGVPTIASTGGALREAGGDMAEYADPDDADAWVRLIEHHLTDRAHHDLARRRVAAYRPPTWGAASRTLADALVAMGGPGEATR